MKGIIPFVSRGSVILYKTMRSSHLILIREFRCEDEDEDVSDDQVLFLHIVRMLKSVTEMA